jgi:Domain of unknown function (DUF397)
MTNVIRWRKSSYSGSQGGNCVEVGVSAPVVAVRKSSYSGGQGGNCVEVGSAAPCVAVRDTKDREGPSLTFSAEAWRTFAGSLKRSLSPDLSRLQRSRSRSRPEAASFPMKPLVQLLP